MKKNISAFLLHRLMSYFRLTAFCNQYFLVQTSAIFTTTSAYLLTTITNQPYRISVFLNTCLGEKCMGHSVMKLYTGILL